MKEEMTREDLQELIDLAAKGDTDAAANLRKLTGGRFENKRPEDTPPFLRRAYAPPDPCEPKDLEELRRIRGYSRAVVDSFVDKACGEAFLPPGAAMILFVMMCTSLHDQFRTFRHETRAKMTQLYRFWDEAHPWVKANILYGMRERLYHQHHLRFCKSFVAKARQHDKIVAEEENEHRGEEEGSSKD